MQQAVAQVFARIDLHVQEDPISALELISRSHFDGFIVDCDGMKHGTEIIAGVRSSRANRKSVIFTIVNGKTSFATAMELGSNFVLGKPLDAGRLSVYFKSSLHKMETGHRRYFRYQLTLRFALPSAQQTVITAIAVLCWSREPIFGMKLFGMDDQSRKAYADWLSSMGLT